MYSYNQSADMDIVLDQFSITMHDDECRL